MTAVNQSQFAALQGVSVGYVTKLKQQGRLVLTREGKVDVEASVQRIRETEDPNRDDVRERWRQQRDGKAKAESTADASPPQTPTDQRAHEPLLTGAAERSGQTYQVARAMKERFLALQAKTDYERSIGELVAAADVRLSGLNLGTMLRTSLESLPDRLSHELAAASDQEAIRARLVEEVESVLQQVSEGIGKL